MAQPAADYVAALAALDSVDIDALVALSPEADHAPARAVTARLDVSITTASATLLGVQLKRDRLARSGRLARARALAVTEDEARGVYGRLCALRNAIAARLISVGEPPRGPHQPIA